MHTTVHTTVWDENTTQTEELLGVDKEDNRQSIMEAALEIAPKDMGTLVALRDQQLKVHRAPLCRQGHLRTGIPLRLPDVFLAILLVGN